MSELDNPAWYALIGEQREFGRVGERAARYLPDVSPIAAVADQSRDALVELASFAGPGEIVAVIAPGELPDQLWRLATVVPLSQWVCPRPPEFQPASEGAGEPAVWTELGDAHAERMYRLAKATDPGPFEHRTHRLGDYLGILNGDVLVAMAGERICLPGYREVSAVCTDPAHGGRGHAQVLVRELVRRQRLAGCLPFLHVRVGSPAEAQATRVYEKLGFVKRKQYGMAVLVRQ